MAAFSWIAYYRVSTEKQNASGLGLEAQREAVHRYVEAWGGNLLCELTEVESGRRSSRPQLAEALRLARIYNATLIIAKLDRLARNVAFVSHLMESKVDFLAVDFPSANRLTVHILAAVAEHETELIRERTRSALRAAKARGISLGGNRGNLQAVSADGARASAKARKLRAERAAADLTPLMIELVAQGLSYRSIAAQLNDRGVPAARGGLWHGAQVHRLNKLIADL